MNAEFNWWLLIVGLVIGAALVWLIMADSVRRDADIDETERGSEAAWIATLLDEAGRPIPADRVEEILRIHRDYLAAPPPDDRPTGPATATRAEAEVPGPTTPPESPTHETPSGP